MFGVDLVVVCVTFSDVNKFGNFGLSRPVMDGGGDSVFALGGAGVDSLEHGHRLDLVDLVYGALKLADFSRHVDDNF